MPDSPGHLAFHIKADTYALVFKCVEGILELLPMDEITVLLEDYGFR
jgi:deferrochelatase/peroxidase EfeB